MPSSRPTHRKRPAGSYDPNVCLVCSAARRAERNPALDAAVALSLSAEVELQGTVSAEFLEKIVSGFLRLTEAEALELIERLPNRANANDVLGANCSLAGSCDFQRVLTTQIAAA